MELLLTRHCQVIEDNPKKLISVYDIPRDQPLIEYVGKFLLASQFYEIHPVFSRRYLFYLLIMTILFDKFIKYVFILYLRKFL